MKYLFVFLGILALLAAGPLLIIWSWNTLFGSLLTIPYTLNTWAAVVLLGSFFKTRISVDRD